MSAKSATLAKSLHTVSALVAVARLVQASNHSSPHYQAPEVAVQCALAALGYAGAADPYGLAQRAVAQLQKGAPRAPRPASGAALLDSGREF